MTKFLMIFITIVMVCCIAGSLISYTQRDTKSVVYNVILALINLVCLTILIIADPDKEQENKQERIENVTEYNIDSTIIISNSDTLKTYNITYKK